MARWSISAMSPMCATAIRRSSNIVHVDGSRSVLMVVLKNGAVSTLSIIEGVKKKVRELKATLPSNLVLTAIGDQSIFVKAAISGVIREGVIAAALTSLMILLFLGSWRSTLIIATSIPLAVLGSIATLSALGETLNIMTLGGLALAVGILVDDATVTIENINWHLEQGKEVETAILDGAEQIVTPAFVSLLCICIVFVPMFFLTGVPRFLFVPMAEAVMSAMVWLLHPVAHAGADDGELSCCASTRRTPICTALTARCRNRAIRWCASSAASRRASSASRLAIASCLALALRAPRAFRRPASWPSCSASFALAPFLGANFFPAVDAGQILMHVRAASARASRKTRDQFAEIEKADPPDHPAGRAGNDGRQHRPAGQRHQHDLQQHRHDRLAGWRHPDQPQ